MDKKITNEQLVAYVYNELPDQEAKLVKAGIENDPDTKQRYEALLAMRTNLGKVKDVEVEAPLILFSGDNSEMGTLGIFNNPVLKRVMAVAAVILVLLVVGRLTGLQISKQQGAITIAFAPENATSTTEPIINKNTNTQPTKSIDSMQFYNYASLQEKNAALSEEVEMLKSRMANVQQNFNRSKVGSTRLSEENLQQIVEQISDKNYKYFTGALEASTVRQEDYIKSLFTDFAIYLDKQRTQDLRNIEHTLINLKQESDIKNLETEEVIAKLIQSVNDKSY